MSQVYLKFDVLYIYHFHHLERQKLDVSTINLILVSNYSTSEQSGHNNKADRNKWLNYLQFKYYHSTGYPLPLSNNFIQSLFIYFNYV